MTRKTPSVLASLLLLVFSLQACAPIGLVLGAGAATGMAAYQERGVDGVARDLRISSYIFELYARKDHLLLKDISVEVYEGRVLLVGQVKTEAMRANAVRLAWTVNGTKDVINEIHVTEEGGFLTTARDAWITTQLEAKLTFDDQVFAINYAIETVGSIVYLIGIAQNQEELDRVINQAKSISYVRHIISHVRIKTYQPPQNQGQAPAGSPVNKP